MDIIGVLQDFFEGIFVKLHASYMALHAGGELALPEGHHHCRTTGTVESSFANVSHKGSCQLTGLSGKDSRQGSVDCVLRTWTKDAEDLMLQLLIPIIIGKLGGLHAEELLDLVLDPLGNDGG